MTWSPFFTLLTPGPTSTTMPAPSCPRTAGNNPSGSAPESVNSSVWQMPVALISTSTSPTFGPSSSTSRISSGLPFSTATAARVFMGRPLLAESLTQRQAAALAPASRGMRSPWLANDCCRRFAPILHERGLGRHLVIKRASRGVGLLRHPVRSAAAAGIRVRIDCRDQGPADALAALARIDEQILQIAIPPPRPGRPVKEHVGKPHRSVGRIGGDKGDGKALTAFHQPLPKRVDHVIGDGRPVEVDVALEEG